MPREGELTFAPFVEGVDFNPRSQTFEWQEDVHQQNFRLKARRATAGRVLRGQLTVYRGAFILADVDLTFRVDIAAPQPPTPTPPGHPPRDRLSLAHFAASRADAGDRYPLRKSLPVLQPQGPGYRPPGRGLREGSRQRLPADRLALRSGEEWDVRLLELIDEASIFQLFWSSNSMRSEYVRRE